MITAEQLAKLDIDAEWLEPLNDTFQRYDINTPLRMAAFIGQCHHESGGFNTLHENLNYSAAGLCKTWPSRFPTLEAAQPYNRNPDMVANKVYSGRMGNTEAGDGALYIGRGCIQLTGKTSYTLAGDALGVDFMHSPDLVAVPKYAALTAGWFWNKRGLNKEADAKDYEGMTKKINGGIIGLADRVALIDAALSVLTS
jgi:putative chitinase